MSKIKSNKTINIISDAEIIEMKSKLQQTRNSILSNYRYLSFDELEELNDVLDNAIWEALSDYNPQNEKNASKKTWCAMRMHWAVADYMSSNSNAVVISKDDYATRKEIQRIFRENPGFGVADVANMLGITEKTVRLHMTNISKVSMTTPIRESEDDLTIEDTIADEEEEDDFPYKELLPLLEGVMDRVLSPRENKVLKSLFGIGCAKSSSVELATEFGISHQMISKIKEAALKKLRCSFNGLSSSNSGSASVSIM